MAGRRAQKMVTLSVLLATLFLQVAYSRRLNDDIDNEVSALPAGNLGNFAYKNPRDYVKISQAPVIELNRNVGTHVELHCEAMGSPPPTIQWYKGNMRITENESFEDSNLLDSSMGLAKVASRLVINYVLSIHAGVYYCVAEAGSQTDRKMSTLVVRGRPMNYTELLAKKVLGAYHHPRVTFWAPAYMDVIGSDVMLPCKSVGNPKPELVWIDPNSKEVINDERFTVLPDGELNIRSISWDDMGVYTCIVRNSVGEDSAETFLYPMQESK